MDPISAVRDLQELQSYVNNYLDGKDLVIRLKLFDKKGWVTEINDMPFVHSGFYIQIRKDLFSFLNEEEMEALIMSDIKLIEVAHKVMKGYSVKNIYLADKLTIEHGINPTALINALYKSKKGLKQSITLEYPSFPSVKNRIKMIRGFAKDMHNQLKYLRT